MQWLARVWNRLALYRMRGVVFLLLSLISASVDAEEGRWWWEGSASLGQRHNERESASGPSSRFDQQELRLALALNGFVVHPTLAEFRLGLEASLSELEGVQTVDSDRLGVDAQLNLLPRGAYPLRLYFRRQLFDYQEALETNRGSLGRVPESSEQAGARLRIRRGFLAGAVVGFESTSLDYENSNLEAEAPFFRARGEQQQRSFLQWSRAGQSIRHQVHLERSERDYAATGLRISDFSVHVDERGSAGAFWDWQLSAVGIDREVQSGLMARRDSSERLPLRSATQDLRLRSRLYRPVRQDDQLDVNVSWGLFKTAELESFAVAGSSLPSRSGEPLRSHGASVFYRFRPKAGFEVAPFVQYLGQSDSQTSLRSPRGGVSFSLGFRKDGDSAAEDFDEQEQEGEGLPSKPSRSLLVSGQASHGQVRTEGVAGGVRTAEEGQSSFSLSLAGTAGKGARLQREAEVEVGRSQLSLGRDPLLELPDLGLANSGADRQDSVRVRLGASLRGALATLRAWGQWQRVESRGSFGRTAFSTDVSSLSLQLEGNRFNVQLTGAQTELEQSIGGQEVAYVGLAGSFRATTRLAMNGSHRAERRVLRQAPDASAERTQLAASYRLGRVSVELAVYTTRDRLAGLGQGRYQGFSWSLQRHLGGWLPFVSRTARRGVIR